MTFGGGKGVRRERISVFGRVPERLPVALASLQKNARALYRTLWVDENAAAPT